MNLPEGVWCLVLLLLVWSVWCSDVDPVEGVEVGEENLMLLL